MNSITYEFGTEISEVLGNMVEIEFLDGSEQGFRKVKETLQRMGVPSHKNKILYQSAHVFHKRGQYYICHFKELFAVDGKGAELSEDDLGRRNLIVKYLMDWDLINPITNNYSTPLAHPRTLKVLKYQDKEEWEMKAKYDIGNKRQ